MKRGRITIIKICILIKHTFHNNKIWKLNEGGKLNSFQLLHPKNISIILVTF